MTLWEHPEDLGMTPRGCPASVWQLQQVRKAYAEFPFITAAGYQCQFEGVDYPQAHEDLDRHRGPQVLRPRGLAVLRQRRLVHGPAAR